MIRTYKILFNDGKEVVIKSADAPERVCKTEVTNVVRFGYSERSPHFDAAQVRGVFEVDENLEQAKQPEPESPL